ncbi:MAG: hypothetical protein J6C23_02665 [Clostridia bacterium]|nr:hypothetical protein [Clostridia bacterium]MBO5223397.1 hypothetical protein [Clostridia bacterium]
MFIHGKTKKKYYSVREKINYYKKVIAGKQQAPPTTKRKAKARLRTLQRIDSQTYAEPTFIVTNDKHFGNGIDKPRLGVVIDTDSRGRLLVASVNHRTSKAVILDKQPFRQVDERKKWIDKSEVYETKYIDSVKSLTRYDKAKIIDILRKK